MYRGLLLIIGTFALILGFIGIFLPILPTTPLILVAAACFAKSSKKAYQWLITNKYFGPIVLNWQNTRTIPFRAKVISLVLLNISLMISAFFFYGNAIVLLFLLIISVAVSIYILRIPSTNQC